MNKIKTEAYKRFVIPEEWRITTASSATAPVDLRYGFEQGAEWILDEIKSYLDAETYEKLLKNFIYDKERRDS